MSIFPDLPISSFKFKTKKDIRTSSFDGGYSQTRPKFTRSTKSFTFKLSYLTKEEAEMLDTFFDDTRGLSFTFIHPVDKEAYTVRLLKDLPDFTLDVNYVHYVMSELTLEEV